MKTIVVILLLVIAGGVGYLVYAKHQERQMVQRFADEMANPGSTVVASWSERAELECKYGVREITTRQAPGGTIPVTFTCVATSGTWVLEESPCAEEQKSARPGMQGIAKGPPTKVGDTFRP